MKLYELLDENFSGSFASVAMPMTPGTKPSQARKAVGLTNKKESIHEEDIKWNDFVKLSKSSGQGGMDWNNFIDYVEKFYGIDGIYADFFKNHDGSEGVTKKEILKHVKILAKDENWQWGQGDTMDREKVRDMMLNARPTSRTHYRGMREDDKQPMIRRTGL